MNQRLDRDIIQKRISQYGLKPADNSLLGSAHVRVMLGWVMSLGLITLVVNLPIYPGQARIGWKSAAPSEQIRLLPMPPEEKEADQLDGSPITVFSQPEDINDPLPQEEKEAEEDKAPLPEPLVKPQKLERIDMGPILEFVEESPAIVGGLSTLYLSIDYPKSARDQGIEGLTVLLFIVEKDGSTRDISVLKPLHPALDSAAVAAVSKTLFKPGRQDGKVVRVKMRLPIRFRLVNPDKPARVDSLAQNSDR